MPPSNQTGNMPTYQTAPNKGGSSVFGNKPGSSPNDTIQHDQKWLKRTNNVLLVLVILTNLYVIFIPFLPQLLFAVNSQGGQREKLEQQLSAPAGTPPTGGQSAPQGNRVIIPSMLLDTPIVEGKNMYKALDEGVWRWPQGSTPDKGGNTVILAHRFTYTQPKGLFYFLDKVKPGDTVGMAWDGKTYVYKVTGTKVVKPTQTEILSPTAKPTLTMYTCTPLWLPKDRLVVTAELVPNPALHPQLDALIN